MPVLASLVLVSFTTSPAPAHAQEAAQRPNIVLVVSDDQDHEQLGFMGSALAETPTLDRLAEEGTVFTTACVPVSRCRASLASLMSGRWPHQTGIVFNGAEEYLDPTDSLAGLLRGAGYATYLAGKYWESEPARMGFQDGTFDLDFARTTQEHLFAFIDEHAGERPFFVWWAPLLPHEPWTPPARLLERVDAEAIPIPAWFDGDAALYRDRQRLALAMVGWFDECLGALDAKLAAAGVRRDTLFVFLIDNGTAVGLVSKGSPFEKGLRTPLLFARPGRTPAGVRHPELVSSLDVYPTILDYAGVEVPSGAVGRSLRPWIEGGESLGRDAVYGALYPRFPIGADRRPEKSAYALYARTERWKYVLYLRRLTDAEEDRQLYRIKADLAPSLVRERGDEDLYDLRADPHELTDLAGLPEHRERIARLRADILAWWERTGGGPLDLP